jgi:3D (Asp-Asp-Asp) domain-containing protein
MLGILVVFPSTLPVTAQEGGVEFRSTTPAASPDTIRSIRDAAAKAETAEAIAPGEDTLPPGAVEPQVIARTFLATAYSLRGQTASGISVRRGIIAADPKVLPLGSVVRLHAGPYSGIYTVMDTGGAIRGQRIDIYLPTKSEAIRFGARRIKVEVIRRGWEPTTQTAGVR